MHVKNAYYWRDKVTEGAGDGDILFIILLAQPSPITCAVWRIPRISPPGRRYFVR